MALRDIIKKILERFSASGLANIAGTFWRMGGSGKCGKNWRRIGVALILAIQNFLFLRTLYNLSTLLISSLITFILAFASHTLGHGVPEHTDPTPNKIGKFWCWIFKVDYTKPYDKQIGNKLRFFIRATVALAYSLAFIPTAILLKHYIGLIISMLALILVIPYICSFRFKDVKEEVLIGAVRVMFLTIAKILPI